MSMQPHAVMQDNTDSFSTSPKKKETITEGKEAKHRGVRSLVDS